MIPSATLSFRGLISDKLLTDHVNTVESLRHWNHRHNFGDTAMTHTSVQSQELSAWQSNQPYQTGQRHINNWITQVDCSYTHSSCLKGITTIQAGRAWGRNIVRKQSGTARELESCSSALLPRTLKSLLKSSQTTKTWILYLTVMHNTPGNLEEDRTCWSTHWSRGKY